MSISQTKRFFKFTSIRPPTQSGKKRQLNPIEFAAAELYPQVKSNSTGISNVINIKMALAFFIIWKSRSHEVQIKLAGWTVVIFLFIVSNRKFFFDTRVLTLFVMNLFGFNNCELFIIKLWNVKEVLITGEGRFNMSLIETHNMLANKSISISNYSIGTLISHSGTYHTEVNTLLAG